MEINRVLKPIYPKLAGRFKISQGNPQLVMSETLVPITDADKLLTELKGYQTSASGASRNDDYTCPPNKYWLLKFGAFARVNAADTQIQVYLNGLSGTQVQIYTPGSVTLGSSSLYDLKLKAGDVVRFAFGAGTSGTMTSNLLYEEGDLN